MLTGRISLTANPWFAEYAVADTVVLPGAAPTRAARRVPNLIRRFVLNALSRRVTAQPRSSGNTGPARNPGSPPPSGSAPPPPRRAPRPQRTGLPSASRRRRCGASASGPPPVFNGRGTHESFDSRIRRPSRLRIRNPRTGDGHHLASARATSPAQPAPTREPGDVIQRLGLRPGARGSRTGGGHALSTRMSRAPRSRLMPSSTLADQHGVPGTTATARREAAPRPRSKK